MKALIIGVSFVLLLIGLFNLKRPSVLSIVSLLLGFVGIIASVLLATPTTSSVTPTPQTSSPGIDYTDVQDSFPNDILNQPDDHNSDSVSTAGSNSDSSFQINSKPLIVDPISAQSITIDPLINKQTTVDAVEFLSFCGYMDSNSQVDEYTLIAPVSGGYRCTLLDMASGTTLSLAIYDLSGNKIGSSSNISAGGGLTVQLNANTSYLIKIMHYSGVGSYTLKIGQPKRIVDISAYTGVSDSTEFYDQKNIYTYTPAISGQYRLYFTDLVSGVNLSLSVYDSMGYKVKGSSNLSNNGGITLELIANEPYSIYVTQYRSYGSYVLHIGNQKRISDISGYTLIVDSAEFDDQKNIYTYTPQENGTYRIHFSEMISGVKLSLAVYDAKGYKVNSSSGLSNGGGITLKLNKGEIYTIYVSQYSNYGSYILNIGPQKETKNITGYTLITDSTEFCDQENRYIFTPATTTDYNLKLSGLERGVKVSISVYDSAGYTVSKNSGLTEGNSLSLTDLEGGQTYYIYIAQHSNYGSYTFSLTESSIRS